MSLIVTVFTNEGLAMAADSRLTLTTPVGVAPKVETISIDFSNSTNKLFVTAGNVGISTCGAAAIKGIPIAGYIEEFGAKAKKAPVDAVAADLLKHFRSLDENLGTSFHVAGYDAHGKQRIYRVHVASNALSEDNQKWPQGAVWNGETDIVSRIFNDCWLSDDNGLAATHLDSYGVPWNFLSLQDAIDFAVFAMSATIGAIRFQNRLKTVGGPIDVLVVKPDGAAWVQRKDLHA
jgi:20S proteasome alpha/beta subunit